MSAKAVCLAIPSTGHLSPQPSPSRGPSPGLQTLLMLGDRCYQHSARLVFLPTVLQVPLDTQRGKMSLSEGCRCGFHLFCKVAADHPSHPRAGRSSPISLLRVSAPVCFTGVHVYSFCLSRRCFYLSNQPMSFCSGLTACVCLCQ